MSKENQLKKMLIYLNEKGIPLPLLRDNKTNMGSITYTILVISLISVLIGFAINMYSYLCFISGVCSIEPKYFPMTEVLMWFGTCAGLYFGRTTWGKSDDNNEKTS